MFGVKTSFAYIIKINKIICIKSVHGAVLWLSEESWEIFVRCEKDGGEIDDFPDIGRHSWNRMLCFFRLLNPWIFAVLRQTWAIKIPGNPLRGVRWLWQLLWVESDDQRFSQSSPGCYWSGQSWGEISVIGHEYLSHIIFHPCRHPRFLHGVIQYCWSQEPALELHQFILQSESLGQWHDVLPVKDFLEFHTQSMENNPKSLLWWCSS